ncbi:type II toxin-antitoxin system RelE/ParE family toxin [Metallibacterium sp.]
MIKQFRHKGIEKFVTSGATSGIQPAHKNKLRLQLTTLNAATQPRDMDAPGWNLHPLHGKLAGHWSVKVNGNWRLTFTFEGQDAVLVDYTDYH